MDGAAVQEASNGTPRHHETICNKEIEDRSLLLEHSRVHTKKRHGCGLCDRTYTRKDALKRHLLSHFIGKPIACELCDARFMSKGGMTQHMAVHAEKKFKCGVCGHECWYKFNLNKHMLVHTKTRFGCDICHKSYSSEVLLKEHVTTHFESPPYPCDICGQHFDQRVARNAHRRSHDQMNFACMDCGKSFHSDRRLKDHVRTHTGKKSFQCSVCHAHFPTASRLRRHFKWHICKICDAQLGEGETIASHVQDHHYCGTCRRNFPTKVKKEIHECSEEVSEPKIVEIPEMVPGEVKVERLSTPEEIVPFPMCS